MYIYIYIYINNTLFLFACHKNGTRVFDRYRYACIILYASTIYDGAHCRRITCAALQCDNNNVILFYIHRRTRCIMYDKNTSSRYSNNRYYIIIIIIRRIEKYYDDIIETDTYSAVRRPRPNISTRLLRRRDRVCTLYTIL